MKISLLFFMLLFLNLSIQAQDSAPLIVEKTALFPGCTDTNCSTRALFQFVQNNLDLSKITSVDNCTSMAVVSFTITEKGDLEEVKLIRDPGGACSEAVLVLMKKMSEIETKWTPGSTKGKAVPVKMNLPIRINPKR